jgi:F0F1-type ATP synthase membrane subunit c/vacuolar-type H+-ATPase subunit K
MSNNYNKPKFPIIWGIVCTLTFLIQLIIEVSGFLFPDLFAIFSFNDLINWRGDFISAFATLTILGVFVVGVLRISQNEIDSGMMFLVIGTGLATVLGLFYISLNFAELFGAFIGTIAEEPEAFEWTFTIYGSIITWIITLPAFLGIKHLKEVTKPLPI